MASQSFVVAALVGALGIGARSECCFGSGASGAGGGGSEDGALAGGLDASSSLVADATPAQNATAASEDAAATSEDATSASEDATLVAEGGSVEASSEAGSGDASIVTEGPAVLSLNAGSVAMAGSGCGSAADTTLTISGGSFKATFRSLQVDLSAGVAQTAGQSACAIRVPAHVPRGYYLAQIVQKFRYDARKSAGASLSASGHVTLFTTNPAVLTMSWPTGAALGTTKATASRTDVVTPGSADYAAWCDSSRAEDDVLGIDVAVSALKDVAATDALIGIEEMDASSGIELVFAPC